MYALALLARRQKKAIGVPGDSDAGIYSCLQQRDAARQTGIVKSCAPTTGAGSMQRSNAARRHGRCGRMAAARPPTRSLTSVRRAYPGKRCCIVARTPARAFATASGDDRTKEKEPSRWEKLQQLFREHGVAFGALYVGANVVTFVPIFGALTIGGVDGPELILWAADQLEITYDLSFVETIHKDLVNAFIVLSLWVEPVRLPAASGTAREPLVEGAAWWCGACGVAVAELRSGAASQKREAAAATASWGVGSLCMSVLVDHFAGSVHVVYFDAGFAQALPNICS